MKLMFPSFSPLIINSRSTAFFFKCRLTCPCSSVILLSWLPGPLFPSPSTSHTCAFLWVLSSFLHLFFFTYSSYSFKGAKVNISISLEPLTFSVECLETEISSFLTTSLSVQMHWICWANAVFLDLSFFPCLCFNASPTLQCSKLSSCSIRCTTQ